MPLTLLKHFPRPPDEAPKPAVIMPHERRGNFALEENIEMIDDTINDQLNRNLPKDGTSKQLLRAGDANLCTMAEFAGGVRGDQKSTSSAVLRSRALARWMKEDMGMRWELGRTKEVAMGMYWFKKCWQAASGDWTICSKGCAVAWERILVWIGLTAICWIASVIYLDVNPRTCAHEGVTSVSAGQRKTSEIMNIWLTPGLKRPEISHQENTKLPHSLS
ncbi:hypothetical protein B0H19DRAFT_1072682 [Mycena capillaripes]|nr:hypothetical protein B0H19DRAFT_1072682 [Mycena capillaripes]